MPRKKPNPKYVVVKNGEWYVRKRFPGLKYPVWRVCKEHSEAGVQNVLNEIIAEMDAPVADEPLSESLTVGDLFDEWLSSVRDQVADRTYADYAENLDRYFRKPLGDIAANDLTEKNVRLVLDELRDRGLSTRTRQYAHRVLNMAIGRGVARGAVEKNPMKLLKAPRARREEIVVYNADEAKRFFAECDNFRDGIIYQFALETGCRPEEYTALQWPDIDLSTGTVSIQRVTVHARSGGGWKFAPPKTKKSRRTILISPQLCERLSEHRERQAAEMADLAAQDNQPQFSAEKLTVRQKRKLREATQRLIRIRNQQSYQLAFPNSDGTPYTVNNIGRREFKDIVRKVSDKPGFTLKSLRHTCATLLLLAGMNPKIVSERLGHSSIVITLETYSHVLPTMQDKASEALASMLY